MQAWLFAVALAALPAAGEPVQPDVPSEVALVDGAALTAGATACAIADGAGALLAIAGGGAAFTAALCGYSSSEGGQPAPAWVGPTFVTGAVLALSGLVVGGVVAPIATVVGARMFASRRTPPWSAVVAGAATTACGATTAMLAAAPCIALLAPALSPLAGCSPPIVCVGPFLAAPTALAAYAALDALDALDATPWATTAPSVGARDDIPGADNPSALDEPPPPLDELPPSAPPMRH